ncbi:MAG: HAD family phosphatase [Terriglobia bacterium]
MLRAIIFDFDGILVDSEPLILKLMQQMAALEGWNLTDEEYYRDYLALDDRGVIELLFRRHGLPVDAARRDELVEWKERAYWEAIRDGLPPFPDAVDFVHRVARRYPLAIASGSLRAEIEHLLEKIGLRGFFPVLVTADDTATSKPDPEVYLKAVERLQVAAFDPCAGHVRLRAAECLAIEDAAAGVDAAHAAGMKCMALAHSLPRENLIHAEWVYDNFGEVDFERIIAEFAAL